jgi:UDP-N-acetylmuramoyl-tripeptide--D-alanyl-D-alanine ligase
MRWTIQQVASAMGVPVPPGLDPLARLAGVSIDSRTVGPDELFIAIRGPRHDGHTFVAAALAAGAVAAVVAQERWPEFPSESQAKLFPVHDPLGSLQHLATSVLRAWRQARPERRVAAVAGSIGKTTTKEILAALLAARFRVLKSEGNLNNEFGLPLTLLRLEDDHEAVVVELGMSRRGELARLTKIAEPEVGVITRVAVEHLEFFSSIDEIAFAERELIENLPGRDSVAVLNVDDTHVARFDRVAPGRVIWFGASPEAAFRVEAIEDRGVEGSSFDFVSPQGRARLALPLVGRHNATNALAALAAASVWGVGAAEARWVFPSLEPAEMRGEVVRFEEGFTVVNDSYNSSPAALEAVADSLAATPGYRRRILAAGEMLELGPTSPQLHREAGRHAAATGKIDWIFGVRGDAAELVRGAIESGHPRDQAQFFASSDEAGKFLASFLCREDLLLIKGSRGVRMEKILEALKAKHPVARAIAPEAIGSMRPGRD